MCLNFLHKATQPKIKGDKTSSGNEWLMESSLLTLLHWYTTSFSIGLNKLINRRRKRKNSGSTLWKCFILWNLLPPTSPSKTNAYYYPSTILSKNVKLMEWFWMTVFASEKVITENKFCSGSFLKQTVLLTFKIFLSLITSSKYAHAKLLSHKSVN